ncbi:3-ketodihydrosphingosine reductase tsc10 [Neolecta irregularis DAH-3]|uniref:3-dehydrosphinganine reductase n=1 Tax=Neolecta irregularis (strain DAH-3) TaxID=1198029 RepID=A0A1U7LGF8_NEOID|nr:3-ketodihydrosphingosine reductase tsc10 [Neolecta irregularis DAH-3]|eukprot:OLL21708.1 3-ketodihydrosphingosine reductase tsc10 [Neolecta irregularis DAH-3]
MYSLLDVLIYLSPYRDYAGTFGPVKSTLLSFLVISIAYLVGYGMFLRRNHFIVDGRLVVITGGSQGMGKAMAIDLSKRGANIVIVARDKSKLKAAAKEIENARRSDQQTVRFVSADLTSAKEAQRALDECGGIPDVLLCCAGMSNPQLFIDQETDVFDWSMKMNYFTALYITHATWKLMAKNPLPKDSPPRHIMFVSSFCGFITFAGYSSYSPTKAALRSLADTLRQEGMIYNIKVHCSFPSTIYTPGFEQEQLIKPDLTKELEGSDAGQTAEQVSKAVLKGLDSGEFLITTELFGNMARNSMKGLSPRNNVLVDTVLGVLGGIIWPFVRFDFDRKVKRYATMEMQKRSKQE